MIPLRWIPNQKNEKLAQYAGRIAENIDHSEPFILVGLSMGGMMAVEIAKIYTPAKLILVSTVESYKQFPPVFRIFYGLRLPAVMPVKILKQLSILKREFLKDSSADKEVLKQVIRDSDPAFIRWGMHAILGWRNTSIPPSAIHIHGSRDEILPLKYTRATHVVDGAGHLMIMERAEEINTILSIVLHTD
jgi:pimeloyl-ACP methyl ester carboxylesterase